MAIRKRVKALLFGTCLAVLTSQISNADTTILLDPGHGGTTAPGASGANGKLLEKSVNLTVALAARDSINFDQGGWFQVGLTRNSDVTVELEDRADSANNGNSGIGYAYFISIHHNAIGKGHNDTQGTEALHCMSDTIRGGSWRDVDSLMAQKIYLRLVENWDAEDDPYVARGLIKSCGYLVLILNRRISVITEASFISDSLEENLFMDPTNSHARDEAGAVYRGFKSYCDGAGIAEISNRYIGGDSSYLEIDYVPLVSPIQRTWAINETHNLYTLDNFYQNGHWYYFHHWSHLYSDGTYYGPEHFDNDWNITVPPESDFHIYRAYFTGGPYYCEVEGVPTPYRYALGDTVQFLWYTSAGVDSTAQVSLYLDRQNGAQGYPELLAANVPWKQRGYLDWVVTGPECAQCRLKVVSNDIAGNTASEVAASWNTFSVCTWKVGDADGSGSYTISDAVRILNYILEGGPPPTPHIVGSGDANCTYNMNISDAVYMINYIVSGGPAPGLTCSCANYE